MEEAITIIYSFLACFENPQKADAVIAFGSYHLPVAQTAAQLVLDNYAPFVVLTGATTTLTKDLGFPSEADYFAQKALTMGLSEHQIIREKTATNTGENIKASMQLIRSRVKDPKIVLACAMPPHLRRIVATFAEQEPDLKIVSTLVPFTQNDYRTRLGMNYGHRLVAELERLRRYPILGFTTPLIIPPEVEFAEKIINQSQN